MPKKGGIKLDKKSRKLQWLPYKNKFEYMTASHIRTKKYQFGYETEKLEYTLTKKYIPDFVIELPNRKLYIETKGNGRSFDSAARAKMVAVKAQHPDLDIRFVFWANGEFGAKRKDGTKQTQMGWAEKNGFKAAVREILDAWLQ